MREWAGHLVAQSRSCCRYPHQRHRHARAVKVQNFPRSRKL